MHVLMDEYMCGCVCCCLCKVCTKVLNYLVVYRYICALVVRACDYSGTTIN